MAPDYPRRAITGLLLAVAWGVGLYAAAPIVGGFGPVAVAEAIIVRSPGWVSTLAVSTFGFYAKPVLLGTVILAGIVAIVLGSLAWPIDSGRAAAVAVGIGTAVSTVLFLAVGADPSVGFVLGLAIAIGPPVVVARLLMHGEAGTDRRAFLRRVGGVTAASAVSLVGLRYWFQREAERAERDRTESMSVDDRAVSIPEGDPRFDFGDMPSAITSPDDHYVVDINVSPPDIDPDRWSLDIGGAVNDPYSLTYEELTSHAAIEDQPMTMLCISNRVGGDLIGTAHWSGIQLSELIDAAEPTTEAVTVITHAADSYSEDLPIEQVEREDILIAFAMGGEPLAREHGFPARLLIPGRYGMKMTKWISRIELGTDEHEAYWEKRGWDEAAVVNPMSYIRAHVREGDSVIIGGVAFAGLESGVEEIETVEVSLDGGERWHDAELEDQLAPHAWRRWRYEHEAPETREFELVARLVTQGGTVQTAEETSPTPSGATGWHRKTVTL